MTSPDEIEDPKSDYSRPCYASYEAKGITDPNTGNLKITELWVDQTTVSWWGRVKHKLVRVI